MVGEAGDLWQVRDDEGLPGGGQRRQTVAHGGGDASRDPGIDLVEDEGGDGIALGDDLLEDEHQARQFAAGHDAGQGQSPLAAVGRHVELDGFGTASVRLDSRC